MRIARTLGTYLGHKVPYNAHADINAIQAVVHLAIGIYLQRVVHHIGQQEVGILILTRHQTVLIRRNRRSPAACRGKLDILLVVNLLLGHNGALHQIYKVRGNVHNTLTLLINIEVPLGTAQRLTRHILEEVVYALLGDGRILGRTLLHLAKEVFIGNQHTLKFVVDLRALGHNIVDHRALRGSLLKRLLQHCKLLLVDSHRLIRQHVNTCIHGGLYVARLLAVITRQDHYVALTLGDHLLQKIVARVEHFVPRCGTLRALVVDLNAVQVHLCIVTLGGIDMNRGIYLVVHIHLHQRSVEVTRVEREEFHLARGAVKALARRRICAATTKSQSHSSHKNKVFFHSIILC